MKKRVVFHCGMHKTGTTAIQKFLMDNQSWIRPQAQMVNRHFEPNFDIRTRTLRSSLLQYANNKIGYDEMYSRIFPIIQDVEFDRTNLCVVSDESLFGEHLGYAGISKVYPKMDFISRVLVDIFEFADVEFLIYTRDQLPWLESVWKQCLKMSKTDLSFSDFKNKYQAPSDWEAYFSSNLSEGVRKRLTVLRYEEELASGRDRPSAFLNHLGVEVAGEIVPLQRVNISKS